MKIPDYVSRSALTAVIDEWIIGNNAERDRQIMRRRLVDGICLEPLAEEFELSPRQIRYIVQRCEARISQHM